MKNAILLIIALGLLALTGKIYYDRQHIDSALGDNESYPHKLARYRAGAEQAVREECTNQVIGLRSIIDEHTVTYDDNFMKWTASATVEYINSVGGVGRTNLEFNTTTMMGDIAWVQKYTP